MPEVADTAAEESVQAVDFRTGQNFGGAQARSGAGKMSIGKGELLKKHNPRLFSQVGVFERHTMTKTTDTRENPLYTAIT